MRRRNRLLQALVAASVLVTAVASGTGAHAAADAPAYTTLRPGVADAVLTETVPIQIVLVGRGPDLLDADELRASFATRNRPIDRMRQTLGIREEIGLEYRYDYTVVHAGQAYEDALFAHLASIGVPERRLTGYDTSLGQFAYDEQERNVLDVHDNLVIDAAAAERWLVEHPAPGIDPTRDTAVLLSWWDRSDFRFHDYKVPAEPHTDTGADFTAREDRRVIAWGGTSPHDEESGFGRESRTWFHDLSAGPDIWTDGWAIDATWGMEPGPDRPYVLPPVWEYLLPGGARRPEQLPQDLYVVLRFVAVNLLFTPSPLRTVDLDGRRVPGDVEVDVTVFDAADGPTHLTPAQLQRELSELTGPLTVDVERRPLVGEPRRCIEGFATGVPCRAEREPRGYPSEANPFLVGARDLRHWRDGSAEHEVGAFVYPAPYGGPWLGVSASNFYDETKSGAFALLSAPFVARGYSQTAVLAHELGHHFALSHPHDGWEPEYEFGYGAAGGGYLHLAWVGDEVSSNMSYLDVNEDFSQLDLDSFRRWRAAAAFRNANAIAADVLASPRASAGVGALADADAAFTAAQTALTAHDYPEADGRARAGYDHVRRAASAAGVAVTGDSRGWTLLDAGRKVGQGGPHPVHPAAEPVSERTRNDALVASLTARRAQGS
jgi:hypothetical protein